MSILFMCFFFIDEIKIKKRSMIEAFSCLKGHRVLISKAVRLASCIINRRDLFETQIKSGTSQQRLRIGTEGLLMMHFVIRRNISHRHITMKGNIGLRVATTVRAGNAPTIVFHSLKQIRTSTTTPLRSWTFNDNVIFFKYSINVNSMSS